MIIPLVRLKYSAIPIAQESRLPLGVGARLRAGLAGLPPASDPWQGPELTGSRLIPELRVC